MARSSERTSWTAQFCRCCDADYFPGSLTAGGAPLTDATGDDTGSYSGGTKKVTVNLGTGATSSTGGKLLVGESMATVTFRVTANANIANNQVVNNVAAFAYAGDLTGTILTGASNAVTAAAVRHHSELSISKSADLTRVQRGAATTVTYTLSVANGGLYDEPAATVTDTLPPGATFGAVTPSSGSCSPPSGQTVTCNLGSLVNGGTATVTVRAVLDGSADPATDTATVSGTNVDSDSSNDAATKATAVNPQRQRPRRHSAHARHGGRQPRQDRDLHVCSGPGRDGHVLLHPG